MFPPLIHYDPLSFHKVAQKAPPLSGSLSHALGFEALLFSRTPFLALHLLECQMRAHALISIEKQLFDKYPKYLLPPDARICHLEADSFLPQKEKSSRPKILLLSPHKPKALSLLAEAKAAETQIFYDATSITGLIGHHGIGHKTDLPHADLMVGAYGRSGDTPEISWVAGSASLLKSLLTRSTELLSFDALNPTEKQLIQALFWLVPSMHPERKLLRAKQETWRSTLQAEGIKAHCAGHHRFHIRLPPIKAIEVQKKMCALDIALPCYRIENSLSDSCVFEGALSLDHQDCHLEQLISLFK